MSIRRRTSTLLSRSFGSVFQRSYATRSSSMFFYSLFNNSRVAATLGATTLAVGLGSYAYLSNNNSNMLSQLNCESVPIYGIPGTNKERSFIAIKPDGVHRAFIGEIISRFEKKDLNLLL